MSANVAAITDAEDLRQIIENLIEKCTVEESEYQRTLSLLKKYRHALFWFSIWFVLTCVVIGMGHGTPVLWAVAIYLAILLAIAIYILVSMRSIEHIAITEPKTRNQALQADGSYSPEQVEEMFEYYYAIDKRNDKVSTTTAVAGSVMGIGTLVLIVALVAFFLLGLF